MAIMTPYKYQFDPSSRNPDNLIVREEAVLATTNHLPIVLREGLFYTGDVQIYKTVDGSQLVPGTDFEFIGFENYIFELTGFEAASAINILDKNFIGTLEISYSCVGGAEGIPVGFMLDLIKAIEDAGNNTAIDFETQLKNKPIYFQPSPHKHPLADATDLDLLKQKFDDVMNALILRAPMQESGNNFQEQIDRMLGLIGSLRTAINRMVADTGYGDRYLELATKLETYYERESSSTDIVIGDLNTNIEIGRFDLLKVNSVRGVVQYNTGALIESVDFIAVGTAGGISQIQDFARISSTGQPVALQLESIRIGSEMILYLKTTYAGTVKVKYYAVL